jgi:predicted DNA-binding transcriptional regulator AlpA
LRDKFSDHDERQTMQHNNKDPLYTLNQAGDYLGRSRSQISALIAQGTFRPIRMAGLNVYNERERRIPKSQLDAWIRSNSGGTVEAYQARLVAQRDAEWKAFKAEAHEATERLKARHLAAPRWQRISWNHSRREAKRLRALAEKQGLGGLFPTFPSKADLESWNRRLEKPSRSPGKPKSPPLAPKPQPPPSIQPAKPWPRGRKLSKAEADGLKKKLGLSKRGERR